MQNKNSFLGKGWEFPPEFSHNDNPTRMSNYEEDIRQSLVILLSTRTGERIHRPYLQPIITQYFIDNKSEIWLLFLIAHSKR